MFDWVRVKHRVGEGIGEVEKAVPHYNYALKGKAQDSDERLRAFLVKELTRAKEILFNIVEMAYKDQEDAVSSGLEAVRDEIDMLTDELNHNVLLWNEKLTDGEMEKVVRADVAMVKNLKELNGILEDLKEQVLRAQAKDLARRSGELKQYVSDLRTVFRERCEFKV